MTNDQVVLHMKAITERMAAAGLTLSTRSEQSSVDEGLQQVGKMRVHPMSQVHEDELADGRAFWLFLEREGRCISCISAKLVCLEGEDFGSHFRSLAESRYSGRCGVVSDVSQPLVDDLKGRLIYFGGIEVAPGERGGIRQLSDFAQYAKLLAATRWEFDWMYTIIAYRHRRLADDYGFTGKYRNAVTWSTPVPEGLSNDQMFLGLNSIHFSHILNSVEPGQL
jgi:hypothetical protein